MPLVIILLALIVALVVCLMISVWDLVTSDRWHWVMLAITAAFILSFIWRAASVELV